MTRLFARKDITVLTGKNLRQKSQAA